MEVVVDWAGTEEARGGVAEGLVGMVGTVELGSAVGSSEVVSVEDQAVMTAVVASEAAVAVGEADAEGPEAERAGSLQSLANLV